MATSTLLTHCGAREVSRDDLRGIEAPPATRTWFPVKHAAAIDTVESALTGAGFSIDRMRFAVSRKDARLFSTIDLTAPLVQGVRLAVGIRNSTDKSLPLGFCAGSRVFVCDNLAFRSELLVCRKHIRAYKVLQDRHRDVMLVNSWHNAWPLTRDTMQESRLIHYFPPKDDDHVTWMNALLAAHGIDTERVITIGPREHRLLPDLYHATDLGVFPNRVEGGNNMVLMEYMCCGKPVIASFNSGHKDIVRRKNAVLIEGHRPMERRKEGELTAVWNDPSMEETIDRLEWCYQNRQKLRQLAQQAAEDVSELTWKRTATELLRLTAHAPFAP